jgi:predicted MFS family arabinose efflux permease
MNLDIGNGKQLFGSMINNGSLVVIGAIAGVAIVAAIIIFLCKKKKADKENENK